MHPFCCGPAASFFLERLVAALHSSLGPHWTPSNLKAQANDAVKNDEALSALLEQFAYTIPQGQYPGDYWSTADGLRDDVIGGSLNGASDDDLKDKLAAFQETLEGLAK